MLDGKVLGVPFVLIVLVIAIAIVVDVPMMLFQVVTQQELRMVNRNQQSLWTQQAGKDLLTPTATVSATPVLTVTATPTVRQFYQPITPTK